MNPIQEILDGDDLELQKALFQFDSSDAVEEVLLKFNLWSRHFFPKYFESPDAQLHEDINKGNLDVYRGAIDIFVDIAFKGAGKDVKTKLFIAFFILNDLESRRRFVKVLAEDGGNSTQSVTDIYNMLVEPRITQMYPDTFGKTVFKREETMSSFTTTTGVKVVADTIYTSQRGDVQEAARPDFIWFNDFETRKTLRSAVITKAIWDNMEEARTGLQKGGGCIYTCNYVSEMGNVHKLVTEKQSSRKRILITPILDKEGNPTWERYNKEEIQAMKETDEDFEGERMCKPSASKDIYFDREMLEKMEIRQPIKEIAGFKIYREYNASHRYGLGGDVAGGVGLDASATVVIDFDTIPAQVVGTFYSNTIQPEAFGDEIADEAFRFGDCIAAPENNKYDQAVLKAKQRGVNLYKSGGSEIKAGYKPALTYGWSTNSLTKSKMFSAARKAIEDGLVALNDPDLIKEAKAYTRNDLIDRAEDPRLISNATRHFDLLTAFCIAWQMKDHAEARKPSNDYGIIKQSVMDKEENPAL
jgi:hypothetical protein